MTCLRVRLEPVEPLLFGDNRSARAGEAHVLGDQDPAPLTLYGAIGARIAECFQVAGPEGWAAVEPVLGRFERRLDLPGCDRAELIAYALTGVDGRHWFPRPLTFRVYRGASPGQRFALPLLHPVRDNGAWSSLGTPWRLASQGPADFEDEDEDESDLLVGESTLGDVLAGEVEAGRPLGGEAGEREELYRPEARLGLAMDNLSNTAVPGRLFSRPYRRFHGGISATDREWRSAGFTAWYRVKSLAGHRPEEWDGTGFLGGDRRRVRFRFDIAEEDPWRGLCARVEAAVPGSAGFFLYLLTPGIVESVEWPTREAMRPVAAAVGRPLAMSGWEARSGDPGPREIRTLYPAGSVFFYEWAAGLDDRARRDWIAERWLEPLPGSWRNPGLGRTLLGVWR